MSYRISSHCKVTYMNRHVCFVTFMLDISHIVTVHCLTFVLLTSYARLGKFVCGKWLLRRTSEGQQVFNIISSFASLINKIVSMK